MGERLFQAWMLFQARVGESRSQEWLASEVSKRLGLKPRDYLNQATVSRWFRGAEPNYETLASVAKVLGCDPGWLAFGPASQAPAPDDPMGRNMLRLEQPDD